jgi:benzoylsuccinyl-CoA thiolase BbsB subunit
VTEQVYVGGVAMIPMGRYPQASYAGLAAGTVTDALRAAGLEPADVQEAFCGHAFGGMLAGQRIMSALGMGGIPVTNVDNACSGGATALHHAFRAIRRGERDVVLVTGVEKLSQFGGGPLPLVTEDREVRQGMVMPALYAMRARRYLYERDATPADLALVSVKARAHGALNPGARLRTPVSAGDVLGSRMIADPLTLFMCCPTGDGAASLVVLSGRARRRLAGPAIRITASVLHSGQPDLGPRDMLRPQISADSAAEAYEMAGTGPDDLDVVELHDAFSIAELIYYEALGLCGPGEGVKLIRAGETTFGGRVVVNPSGGLLAKGHPVGASGAAQIAELFWQLTGQAGARQVPGARTGLAHVTGGGIAGLDHGACAVHLAEQA